MTAEDIERITLVESESQPSLALIPHLRGCALPHSGGTPPNFFPGDDTGAFLAHLIRHITHCFFDDLSF